MGTITDKRIIEVSGRLLAENGPGTFSLGMLSIQPEMQGLDIFRMVRNEEKIFEQIFLQLEKELMKDKMIRDLKKYRSETD
jgi:hypothetical protein